LEILISRGHEITIACNEKQREIFLALFPDVKYVHLDGYEIQYPTNGRMALSMTFQSGKIIAAIKKEQSWVKDYVEEYPQDFIISDNRFGFHHSRIESIYITHQINIQGPSLLKPILYTIHKTYIDNFHHCWIPDGENCELTGTLSKTAIRRFKFIGVLSRFKKAIPLQDQYTYKYLGIVSGPEPQKSVFLKLLEEEFSKSGVTCAIIGGTNNTRPSDNITYFNHLNPEEFRSLIQDSELCISRSGYSTIMDFSVLQKPIHFVPTSGQTEQEYLAKHHKKTNNIGYQLQNNFKLPDVSQFGKVAAVTDPEITLIDRLDRLGL
jgi:UDP-N-acetylglucosamine transferase subunit ALG13